MSDGGSADVAAACRLCVFGPRTFVRGTGAPEVSRASFSSIPGPGFVAAVRGTTGPGGFVRLNGAVLFSDASPANDTVPVLLLAANTIEVMLTGPAKSTLWLAIRARNGLTFDAATFSSSPLLDIDGAALPYAATLTNHGGVAGHATMVRAWIVQGAAQRAAGSGFVDCGGAAGDLPPGVCVSPGHTLSASNSTPGIGTLVPGAAAALMEAQTFGPAGTSFVDSLTIPVTLTSSTPPAVIRVDVNPTSFHFDSPGLVSQLTANVTVVGNAPKTVAWSSSNPVAVVVGSNGSTTSLSAGAALVTAVSTFDPTKRGTSLVTVVWPPVLGDGVLVGPGTPTLVPGQQVLLAAQVDGVSDHTARWSSSNTLVATVNSVGQVTAIGPGAALINASSVADPAKSGTSLVSVDVLPAYGNGVNVSPGGLLLAVGGQARLAAQVIGGPNQVAWTSSNSGVAPVSSFGTVTGVMRGPATITATAVSAPANQGSSSIEVYDFNLTAPNTPTAVSTGTTQPPANPVSTLLVAGACGSTTITVPGVSRVDFYANVLGAPVLIGATSSFFVTDNGLTRCFNWSMMWTPGSAFGTGPQALFARGYDAHSRMVAVTPTNGFVTITDP